MPGGRGRASPVIPFLLHDGTVDYQRQQGTAMAGGGEDIQPLQLCCRPPSIDYKYYSRNIFR